jgi:hypothetical protein
MPVIASPASPGVAIQLDVKLSAFGLGSFVIPQGGTPRNDKLYHYPAAAISFAPW